MAGRKTYAFTQQSVKKLKVQNYTREELENAVFMILSGRTAAMSVHINSVMWSAAINLYLQRMGH
jgi:hypothetical protein